MNMQMHSSDSLRVMLSHEGVMMVTLAMAYKWQFNIYKAKYFFFLEVTQCFAAQ